MIDLIENKVLGPMIQQKYEQGLERGIEQGLEQGRAAGKHELLRDLLAEKFGALPAWALQRLDSASSNEVNRWTKRSVKSTTLEETLS